MNNYFISIFMVDLLILRILFYEVELFFEIFYMIYLIDFF
jgi:hypothetical protein